MKISFRRRKSGVRYCARITAEHQAHSRSVWHKRLKEATERVRTLSKRPWSIDDWTEMTRARLNFAHIWYQHKFRFDGYVTAEDFMAYIVMATV